MGSCVGTKLDELDARILEMLQENADLTYSEIAKKVGASPSTVYMRIKKLKERGIIKKVVAVVDPESLGYRLRAVIFLLIDVKKFGKVIEVLSSIPQIKSIYDVTGEWTLVCYLLVRDHEELSRVLDQVGSIDGVLNTLTLVVLRVIKEDDKVLP